MPWGVHPIESCAALAAGVFQVLGAYGFMEAPDIPELLELARAQDLPMDPQETTFFLSRETIVRSRKRGWRSWRNWIYALLSRNAQPATAFFQLPVNRVVELGMQVEL